MSTKIYNAFKFEGTGEELISILKEIKKEYISLTKAMFSMKTLRILIASSI